MLLRLLPLLVLPLAAQSDWDEPFPAHRIADNLYYVGSKGLSTYLVTSRDGHILINSSFDRTIPLITKSVESLGFKMSDVKIILASHAHDDHVGGHAMLQKVTGAKVYVMKGDDVTIESGGAKGQYLFKGRWAPCKVDKVLKDGDEVKLGEMTLRAHLTPGHTRGNTTWTMQVSDGGRSLQAVIVGSPSVNNGYQLVNNPDYPEMAADYARTFRVLKALECDIFLGSHGQFYGLTEKHKRLKAGGANPFIDPTGYREFVADREQYYLYTLEKQQKQ